MVTALYFARPLGQISVNSLVPYYLLISLVYPLTVSKIDDQIDELTHTGEINTTLLKPLSLFRWLYAKDLSEKFILFLILFPVFIIISLKYFLNPFSIVLLLISFLLCFTLSFSLSFFVGLFCFWVDEFWAVHNVKHVVIQLLGGVILPYTFFPSAVAFWLRFTPFPYLVNLPVRVIQNSVNPMDFLLTVFWIIVFIYLGRWLLRQAVSKYSYTAS